MYSNKPNKCIALAMLIACFGSEPVAIAARKVPKLNTDSYAVYDKPKAIEAQKSEQLSKTTNDRKGDIKAIFKKYDENFDELVDICLAKIASSDWKNFNKFVSNTFFEELVKELNANFYVNLKVEPIITDKELIDFVESKRFVTINGEQHCNFGEYTKLLLLEKFFDIPVNPEFVGRIITTRKGVVYEDIKSLITDKARTRRNEMETECERSMREIYKNTRDK